MDILPNITPIDPQKAEIEAVQQEQQEYYLIGSFLRTRGLKLFVYNPRDGIITEIKPEVKTTITTALDPETGLLVINDRESKEKCLLDTRNTPFEALNMKNAEKRVNKYLRGEIKELCNLIKTDLRKKIIS